MLHAVNLGEELVDHGVVHARAARTRSPLLANGIQLIKNDDVKAAVGSQLVVAAMKRAKHVKAQLHVSENVKENSRPAAHPLLLVLGVGEQLADVGLRLAHVFVEDFRAVDDLWLAGVEHFANLPGHEGFSAARRSKQQDALHVLTAWTQNSNGIVMRNIRKAKRRKQESAS